MSIITSLGLAVIHKKTTQYQIVKVDYLGSAAVIETLYPSLQATTDYNGVYRGFTWTLETKETRTKHRLPFKSFHTHQIEHMKKACLEQKFHGYGGLRHLRALFWL